MKVLGGEVIAAMLARESVERVFGIVDGTYAGLYASFEKYGIELFSPRHETTAAHMAGAYARLTGKLGVCMASNGPGVANILPGAVVESAEGNRVLLLTSSRRQGITYPDRGGTYQCFDQVGTLRAACKWSEAAPSFERIPEVMRKALRACYAGRPGVVHVDVPENVLNGTFEIDEDFAREPGSYRRTHPLDAPPEIIERAAELLRGAERPLLHAGSGVIHAGATEELAELAALLEAPVSASWAASSAMPCSHPRRVPTWALEAGNHARQSADVVLVVGSRLGETDFWGKAPYWGRDQLVIQVDIDEEILGLHKAVELSVLCDARVFLRRMVEALQADPGDPARAAGRKRRAAEVTAEVKAERAELDKALSDRSTPVLSAKVPHACRQVFPDDAVCIFDGGNAAVWASFYHPSRSPNTLLSTFKFGMLGAGIGQALGAKAAAPERDVYCILGDGAMGFHPQELETAVRHRLPVTFVVLCDKQWGMVKLTQTFALGPMRQVLAESGSGSERGKPSPTINADLCEIAFDELARSMGAHGERVSAPDELEPALERCRASGLPAVLHVDVDPMRHLMPPGLLQFKKMHEEPEG